MKLIPVKATDFVWDKYSDVKHRAKFLNGDGQIINGLFQQIRNVQESSFTPVNKTAMLAKLGVNLTMMHIYFKSLGVTQYQREENYGIMDVIGRLAKRSFELLPNTKLYYIICYPR